MSALCTIFAVLLFLFVRYNVRAFRLCWLRAQMRIGFPVRSAPQLFAKNLELTVQFRTRWSGKIGYALAERGRQVCHSDCIAMIRHFLCQHLGARSRRRLTVPPNAVSVSIAMPNFSVGTRFGHTFFPKIVEKVHASAFYTYQMLSKRVEATYYNAGGVEFLAGLCYYPQLATSTQLTTDIDRRVLNIATWQCEPFPLRDRASIFAERGVRNYGRFCERLGKRVLVNLTENGEAVHLTADHSSATFRAETCEECTDEATNYTFETERDDCYDSDDQFAAT
ncbi:unnamed protein product [Caenorhabditis sp. 36 PRJEB53466]|nr:unnamed protein product [Caenorhabditis sp. 36 PRJEB53466]